MGHVPVFLILVTWVNTETPLRRNFWSLGFWVGTALALLAVWHFGAIKGGNLLVQALHTAAHFPVFGALTAVVFVLLRVHVRGSFGHGVRTYLAAYAVMIAVSLTAEGLQTQLEGRYGSLRDVGVNLLGAKAALALLAMREPWLSRAARPFLWCVVLVSTAIVFIPVSILGAAYAKRAMDFPALVRFSHALDVLHVTPVDADIRRTSLPCPYGNAHGPPSLQVILKGGRYPGITFRDPAPDWKDYAELHLDFTNPEPDPLTLILRIDDAAHDGRHDDRFNHPIQLAPQARQTVRVPLALIRRAPKDRSMHLDQIARMLLFGSEHHEGRTFYLSGIWLSREEEGD